MGSVRLRELRLYIVSILKSTGRNKDRQKILIPGNALINLRSLPLSDDAPSDVITYMTLNVIRPPRIGSLSTGQSNTLIPTPTPPLP